MKKLLSKNIGFISSLYFALGGLVFLSTAFSGTRSGMVLGLTLFGISILPMLGRMRIFRIVYGILSAMVSFPMLLAIMVQSFDNSVTDFTSKLFISGILLGYLAAAMGLIYSSVKSLDQHRFSLT